MSKRRPLTFTDKYWALKEADGKCTYCKAPLRAVWFSGAEAHFDHAIPLARGGDDWPTNIVAACAQCNLKKKTMTAFEFICQQEGFEVPGWAYYNPEWEAQDWSDTSFAQDDGVADGLDEFEAHMYLMDEHGMDGWWDIP